MFWMLFRLMVVAMFAMPLVIGLFALSELVFPNLGAWFTGNESASYGVTFVMLPVGAALVRLALSCNNNDAVQ